MNAKILIVALCAFQLAAGGLLDSLITGPLSVITAPINALLGSAQGQGSSIDQQFQDLFSSFSDNVSSQMNFELGLFDFLNGDNRTDACRSNLTKQFYAIGNETKALFIAGISILNETIRNSSQILVNVSRSLQNAIPQAISNFTQCTSSYKGLFSSMFAVPTCAARVAGQQFSNFANTTSTQIQAAQKIFNQLLSPSNINSTVHTLPQMADLAGRMSFSAAGQFAAVAQDAMMCVAQALNATVAAIFG